jgi:ubiquinone/menaquinone biosynthesis C-methylase UbiE
MNENTIKNSLQYQAMMVDGLNYSYTNWITAYVQRLGHKYIEKRRRKLFRCLEVGCGTAEYLEQFGKGNYTGIDASKEAIQKAQLKYPGREFVCGDMRKLPFDDETFDCVVSNYVFEHVQDLDVVFDEIIRVLKPKGRLLVSLPTEGGWAWDVGRRMTSKRYMEKKFKIDYMALIKQEHVQTCHGVIMALKRKFTIVQKKYLPFLIPTVHLNAVVGVDCRKK